MEKETLEDREKRAEELLKAAENVFTNSRENYKARRGFIEGAMWQQERMYSKEDMEEAFTNGLNRSFDSDFDRWLEQFKKK